MLDRAAEDGSRGSTSGSGPTEPKMDQYSSKMGQLSSKTGPAPHFLAAAGGGAS